MIKLEWTKEHMRVLNRIGELFKRDKVFSGIKIGLCLHLEAKTACLAMTLHDAGAKVAIAGSNPLSTKDYAASELSKNGVEVFAKHGESMEEYYENINKVLDIQPDIIIDDGADMSVIAHKRGGLNIRGCAEETTTGVKRLRALEKNGSLLFPAIDVNGASCKHLFDNRFGTGQSAFEGIMLATNMTIAGKQVVVCGFGDVGKGIAEKAKGLGAIVAVTEVDPVRALEAHMEGYMVMPMSAASRIGDIFITATGNTGIMGKDHIKNMKSGAVLANAGHFNVEIDTQALSHYRTERIDENITCYHIDGKKVYLLGDGRLVNLACANGHAIEIMDMSFSLQALAARYLLEAELENRVYKYPYELDTLVANLKLSSLDLTIDELSEEQKKYMESWGEGT